ncbi:hypothetical protein BaRGS_00035326 [Batillaria attramentaria]|uniref:Uncharacterized protein n=1 Tax=Batillaria attramentaria TaxID=370345 RepID=A0ABD0JEV2_9CAEN
MPPPDLTFARGVCVVLALSFFAGHCADVELQCPEKWTEGARTTLVCTVNATRLTSTVCSGQLTDTLDFDFKVAGPSSIPVSQCQVQDYQSQCSGILNADGCKCQTSAEGNYVFTLTVTASRNTHRGGSWDCSTTCKDGTLRDVLDYRGSVGCSPVVFETLQTPTTSPVTSKTVTVDPTYKCTDVDCRAHCDKAGCICVIFFLGVVFPLCVAALVIFLCIRYPDKFSKLSCCKRETHNRFDINNAIIHAKRDGSLSLSDVPDSRPAVYRSLSNEPYKPASVEEMPDPIVEEPPA